MLTIPNKNDACRRRRNFCASALLVNCKRRKVFFHLSLLSHLFPKFKTFHTGHLLSPTTPFFSAVPNTNNIIHTRVMCLHNTIANSIEPGAGQYRDTIQVKLYLTLSITCYTHQIPCSRRHADHLVHSLTCKATACA